MDSIGVNCKGIILRKLSSAVVCSVLAQTVILIAFLFLANINILYPLEWFKNVFQAVSSISTWLLYILPFASIVFAQSIVCAKDYVVKPVYNISKFRKLILHCSIHNIALLLLHTTTGFLNIWLYLSLTKGIHGSLYITTEKDHFCLAEENLFMILGGFWIGFFFFITYCTEEENIQFPVVQQKKLVQFKTKLLLLLEKSRKTATWPTINYIIFYFFCRSVICQTVSNIINVTYTQTQLSVTCYIYLWVFTIIYHFFMNLMSLFFKLFLTEAIQFPLRESTETSPSLTVAIEYSSLPIIQHLACLDLYMLSVWSVDRRKTLFSLSQPGEHPHYWNKLFGSSLRVISQFTKSLNDSVSHILEPPKKEDLEKKSSFIVQPESQLEQSKTTAISPFKSRSLTNIIGSYIHFTSHKQYHVQTNSTNSKYGNMRNMTLINTEQSTETVRVAYQFPKLVLEEVKLYMKLNALMTKMKKIFAFDFFFGEITEANVHSLLRNGQLIVWLTQALSHLTVAAFSEDTYGVVQKDLPILIIALLELRKGIEKLNTLLMLNKRGGVFKEHNVRMKHNINAAVKRSLYNICLTYKDCIDDLPLNEDIHTQLEYYRKTGESCRTASGYHKNPVFEGFV